MKTCIADTPAPGPNELYDSLEGMVASLARIEAAQGSAADIQALQDTLHALQQPIAALVQLHGKQQDAGMLLADVRDTITEAVGVMHSQLSDVLLGIRELQHPAAPPTPKPWPWLSYGLGAVAGLALMAGVWFLWPTSPYRGFAVALDGSLAQHYHQLPKAAQESVEGVYRQHGFVTPAARKGTK